MAKKNAPLLGIDLGTTRSVVAFVDADGKPETIRNREGDLTTPSVVLFEENQLTVGKEALNDLNNSAVAHVQLVGDPLNAAPLFAPLHDLPILGIAGFTFGLSSIPQQTGFVA